MMSKTLLKLEKEVESPLQRKNMFRNARNTKDRVCKVIIDSGRTENLVST
jgi:hypothetical protein